MSYTLQWRYLCLHAVSGSYFLLWLRLTHCSLIWKQMLPCFLFSLCPPPLLCTPPSGQYHHGNRPVVTQQRAVLSTVILYVHPPISVSLWLADIFDFIARVGIPRLFRSRPQREIWCPPGINRVSLPNKYCTNVKYTYLITKSSTVKNTMLSRFTLLPDSY